MLLGFHLREHSDVTSVSSFSVLFIFKFGGYPLGCPYWDVSGPALYVQTCNGCWCWMWLGPCFLLVSPVHLSQCDGSAPLWLCSALQSWGWAWRWLATRIQWTSRHPLASQGVLWIQVGTPKSGGLKADSIPVTLNTWVPVAS